MERMSNEIECTHMSSDDDDAFACGKRIVEVAPRTGDQFDAGDNVVRPQMRDHQQVDCVAAAVAEYFADAFSQFALRIVGTEYLAKVRRCVFPIFSRESICEVTAPFRYK